MPQDVSKMVKVLRQQHGYTQDELAAKIGKSDSYIGELEKGNIKSPGIDVIEGLARAFGISPLAFFERLRVPEYATIPPECEDVVSDVAFWPYLRLAVRAYEAGIPTNWLDPLVAAWEKEPMGRKSNS